MHGEKIPIFSSSLSRVRKSGCSAFWRVTLRWFQKLIFTILSDVEKLAEFNGTTF